MPKARKMMGRVLGALDKAVAKQQAHKAKRSPRYDYEVLGAKFMRFAPKEPFQAATLRDHFKGPKGVVFKVAQHLIKAGKLKSAGKGAGRRLVRA